MNEIKVFENEDFGSVRTATIDNKVYFCGKDIAVALGYSRPADAISDHCKGVAVLPTPTNGGVQQIKFIPEGDVYRLIVHSKLPNAERFERWVFDDVLPSIHKYGAYMTPETLEAAVLNPDYLIKIAQALKDEQERRKELEVRNKELKDTNDILVKDIADCDYCALINNLVRSYAGNVCNNQFGAAFRLFYRRLYAKYGICLGKRKSAVKGSKEPLISFLKDTEIGNAARVALAMCEESGINAGEVIGNTNLQKVREVAK